MDHLRFNICGDCHRHLFSEVKINNSVGSTDELSAYTGNGLGVYVRDDIMTPAHHATKLY
ncbi:Glycerophosphodiester phosphodiesterase domain-containing protein 5 [Labeo rohita]|uniref:Glycerophosphodiester phosphodiesterase domain-containing protein 5 n=1 Tax=Labeo rohita TaxID=84645 RepID=A0ABQ8MI45_LABRO|nr:Glycerophosphodiester phosphodiesterase domain-containing protein 5 [Labeo rohita]